MQSLQTLKALSGDELYMYYRLASPGNREARLMDRSKEKL
jgi:hypothetical protein